MLQRLDKHERWDIVVIGAGATGLGCAVDAAARGYRTLLVDRTDFASGTSSRSIKLAHGGVRYLQRGDVTLVTEALHERGLLRRNAPHLVHDLQFVVPNYDWWEAPLYGIGLKVYDLLAGKLGFGASRILSKEETVECIPTIETEGLRGGVLYFDGQFDDARLAINLAQTAAKQGATLLNYVAVVDLVHRNALVDGVVIEDLESSDREGRREIRASAVVNATGVFADSIRRLDDPKVSPMIRASQGIHIVLDRDFLPGDSAIMVPHTDDGRALFAIPWHGRVLVGTTDTPVDTIETEPRPFPQEVDFLLRHCARYLTRDPQASDVLSVFAGLRPLVRSGDGESTAEISRDHVVSVARSGLVTIAGGKWTTYRKMAQDTIDQAAVVGGLPTRPCTTSEINAHGYHAQAERFGRLAPYGSDAPAIEQLAAADPECAQLLHPSFEHSTCEVIWAAREEMALTVHDVLARRTRMLLLDARASIEAAPAVAAILARELGRDEHWARDQVTEYEQRARGYLVAG